VPNQEKLIYPYDITDVTELRQAWEVAYENGVHALIGAMFASLDQTTINKLYNVALAEVRGQMEKAGQL
jgi:hypothetical protein